MEWVLVELESVCEEKMRQAIETEEGLGIEYDEDVVCDVCRSPEGEDGNEMVFCDKCNVCVHQVRNCGLNFFVRTVGFCRLRRLLGGIHTAGELQKCGPNTWFHSFLKRLEYINGKKVHVQQHFHKYFL